MNRVAINSADIDNLWRRLPCMLATSLVIWAILLWGFGLLLKNMADEEESLKPITAEVMELHPPVKPLVVPSPAKPKLVRKTTPPQLPSPVQKPEQPSIPAVSVPVTNIQPGKETVPYSIPSVAKPITKSVQVSGEPIEPPQFGAAYLNNPKPRYPAFARKMGIQGTVMLKVLVSRQGLALKVEVAQSSGSDVLDNAAAETVKNWRFVPARRGDSPIDEWVRVPVAFNLTR